MPINVFCEVCLKDLEIEESEIGSFASCTCGHQFLVEPQPKEIVAQGEGPVEENADLQDLDVWQKINPREGSDATHGVMPTITSRPVNESEKVIRPEKEPNLFVHRKCGNTTRISDWVRTNSVIDPYFYFLGIIKCSHCGWANQKECHWVKTKESLDDYYRRLRKTKDSSYHLVMWGMRVFIVLILLLTIPYLIPIETVAGYIMFVVMFSACAELWIGRYTRLILCWMKVI